MCYVKFTITREKNTKKVKEIFDKLKCLFFILPDLDD